MSEKSVFPESLSHEMRSQSFPVTSFWYRGFGTSKHGAGKSLPNFFFFLLFLSVHCGDFIRQIKKKSVIYILRWFKLLKVFIESAD